MKPILTAVAALLALAACAEDGGPAGPSADAEAGRGIVEANCTGCHGLDGAGRTGDIPNIAAQPADYLAEAMLSYREGRREHAALRDLIESFSEQDIRDIAAYFSSLPPVQPTADEAAGQDSYREGEEIAGVCTSCHGEGGFSDTEGVPSLAGQQPAYLIISTQEYASGRRGHPDKQKMLQGLDGVDIEKMAMYFAAQSPEPRTRPPFGDPAAGEPLTAMCGRCHGARGVSRDPLIPNLAGQEPHYLRDAIKAYRNRERSHEDMVSDRSDAEIDDIAAFYSVQRTGPAVTTGEALEEVVAKCDRCHGPGGEHAALAVPSLDGQQREYLSRVIRQYRVDDRGNAMMHKMSSVFDDEMVEAIADYYSRRAKD